MELNGKNVLVVGLGASGRATAAFLNNRGARVTVTDRAREEDLGTVVGEMRDRGIRLELGAHRRSSFESADLVVISPGVPHTIAPIAGARARGVRAIGEVELACRFITEPIIAITGTNGKTTTTSLVGSMLTQSGIDTFVGGNIGAPLIGYVDSGRKAQRIVAEISSFQLDTIETFKPDVAVLLNIADDHLDRYTDFADYARSKMRIFENQTAEDTAILNANDGFIGKMTQQIRAHKLFFTHARGDAPGGEILQGALIQPTKISFQSNRFSRAKGSVATSQIRLKGIHNLENAAAAALAAFAADGTLNGIKAALKEYPGLPHRLEYIGTLDDVDYYNDSKATNTAAVLRALESFTAPVILILGGRNKGGNFLDLKDMIAARVKQIIAIGEATDEIVDTLGHLANIRRAASMQAAMRAGRDCADPGDVVLLSPACASFDMYTSYAQRGEDFRRAFEEIRN